MEEEKKGTRKEKAKQRKNKERKMLCVKRSPPMRSQIEEQDFDARLGSKTGKTFWGTIAGMLGSNMGI